tara:strand:+ start:137 stop:1096 length:960 start_codon:yes stop_codon:yes gene_type:complete
MYFAPGLFSIEAQQPRVIPALPANAKALPIQVARVTGDVTYTRQVQGRTRVRTVTRDTKLQPGDTLHLDIGSRCLLLFGTAPPANNAQALQLEAGVQQVRFIPQAPSSDAENVAAAVLLRGYSEVKIAAAHQLNQANTIQLDMPQGVARAGVDPSLAVRPSFRIRTPRTVVAVRGTEIRELETSIDKGDILAMGRSGIAATTGRGGLTRSARKEQGTRRSTEPTTKGTRLVRAINTVVVKQRVVIAGPHRSSAEFDQASRESQDARGFGLADKLKPNGNPVFQQIINSGTTPHNHDAYYGQEGGGGGGSFTGGSGGSQQ